MLKSTSLENIPGVRHAFFTRDGGVSDGIYASLNCGAGSSDEPENVLENKRRAAAHLKLEEERLVTLYQVHSAEVVTLTDPAPIRADRPQADAMVTRVPNIALGILTADCAPVLFADAEAGVIGAAHAGWRGLAAGILEATVRHMENQPGDLMAWMGPAISQPAFEVGSEVRDAFVSQDPGADEYFELNERGRWQADLYALARRRLAAVGIGACYGGGLCTFRDKARFFSYRRDADSGRMVSFVALKALENTGDGAI